MEKDGIVVDMGLDLAVVAGRRSLHSIPELPWCLVVEGTKGGKQKKVS